MPAGAVRFEQVWKRFRRGEHHDSLRDLVPALVGRAFGRRREAELAADEFWALKDVSFEVRAGEAFGIIGPNGAGKSTTLKLLTGLLAPTRGRCAIEGRVGALIDLAAGFRPELTGRENIYLRGAILGMTRAETATRFDEIVEFAGVAPFVDTPLKRYSSGMSARLGFAVAAQLQPDVLIVDEVVSVGDHEFRQRCHDRMAALKREGAVVVAVSHNLSAIEALCDRVLLLKDGVTEFLGAPDAALRRYHRPAPIVLTPPSRSPAAPKAAKTGRRTASGPRVVGALEVLGVAGPDGREPRRLSPGDQVTVRLRVPPSPQFGVTAEAVLMTLIRAPESGQVASCTRMRLDLSDWIRRPDGFELTIGLTLHLLRGAYAARFSLIDPTRTTRLRSRAVRLAIRETASVAGMAHVVTTAVPSAASATTIAS